MGLEGRFSKEAPLPCPVFRHKLVHLILSENETCLFQSCGVGGERKAERGWGDEEREREKEGSFSQLPSISFSRLGFLGLFSEALRGHKQP